MTDQVTGVQVLHIQDVKFYDPREDIHTARLPIAGRAWVDTDDGVVLIDTLISENAAQKALEKINGKIKYIIYTHGHGDHIGGTAVFMADQPEIIANKYLPDRLDKYKMLAPYRARSGAIQFHIPESSRMPREMRWSTSSIRTKSFCTQKGCFNEPL